MAVQPVASIDVDDTFVRSASHARIAMPEVVAAIRTLRTTEMELSCWSSGGAEYARASAQAFGVDSCFVAFLPKPTVLLDDVPVSDWRQLDHVYPLAVSGLVARLSKDARNDPGHVAAPGNSDV